MSITEQLTMTFRGRDQFSLPEAYMAVPQAKPHSVRARIYEGLKNNRFLRLAEGVYAIAYTNGDGAENTCVLVHGDGRDLSFLRDSSIDCIITDHPYAITGALKGGNRDFASYDLFQYTEQDFEEKYRVLKPGCFLVEFLPEESAENFDYLTRVKQMAMKVGFLYYAKVPWVKGEFVANTGRKSKNTEDVLFFSKGKARSLRVNAKLDKEEPSVRHFMSGTKGMLPTAFNFAPPRKSERIHQAEKPLSLLSSIIDYVSLPGEWLLDQFAGSGVLGAACTGSERNCFLIEKDKHAVSGICHRLALESIM